MNSPPVSDFLDLQSIVREITRKNPFASVDEINRALEKRVREYNNAPQTDLGGLSPEQMQQVLYGDWHGSGALRLNEGLTLDDVVDAPFFADARTLLGYFEREGMVKETPAKNLPRAAVSALLPLMRLPTPVARNLEVGFPPPRNEGDVIWLQALRHVLELAGLLTRRKGLRVSRTARELTRDEHAGRLYALLFRTLFRTFNLRWFDSFDGQPALQASAGYSLYKLNTVAREWTSELSLAESAWLPSAKEPPSLLDISNGDLRYFSFRHQVLSPLVQFGLLEDRPLPTKEKWRELIELRCTPLYSRFIRFQFRQ